MQFRFPDYAQFVNLPLLEEIFSRYQKGEGIDSSWRHFFEGINFADSAREVDRDPLMRIFSLIQAYRRYGHLQAHFDPLCTEQKTTEFLALDTLGFSASDLERMFPSMGFVSEKWAPLKEIIRVLENRYCGTIGFEFMHLDDPRREQWLQKEIEMRKGNSVAFEEKRQILEMLIRAEFFETFLHMKFVGQKRFSLEGEETLIPMLREVVEEGSRNGIEEFVIGMAHRGRLNVLVNLFGKPYSVVFREFEDLIESIEASGDVKYHKGFSSEIKTSSGKAVTLHLAANPSHLESVDSVALGQTRARLDQNKRAMAILIHGDAALAGQGVVYESLQLMHLPGYSVGGTIHIVLNNQIGFTTGPREARSTRYCTDLAKSFCAPIFHLNAEDPEGSFFAARLAVRMRQLFSSDVFLDLNGYRKYGHNEGDEPAFTQPLQQKLIRKKQPIRALYCQQLLMQGHVEEHLVRSMEEQVKVLFGEALVSAQAADRAFGPRELFGHLWEEYAPVSLPSESVATHVEERALRSILATTSNVPEGFHLHPKLQKLVQERTASSKLDWNTAEWLAFGSLLLQGIPIRLSGQDSERGTFSQRHMVWIDQRNETRFCPLAHLAKTEAAIAIINSPLSEYAAMGFELGYSWSAPKTLVLWEAQFGDFANGAQIIIDQYLSSSEQKWNRASSLVLLLPHAFEGQGSEHSSGRLERFLQLCAHENMQIVNATTPAQYFHLLRRQALQRARKPLVVFTPKSLLRHPACVSTMRELTSGTFEGVLDDPTPPHKCSKVVLCSGHVFYDLLEERKQQEVALVRIEQYYPLHREQLKDILARYPVQEVRWVQEEPENMGAWQFLRPYLEELLPTNVSLQYVGREPSAAPATGSHRIHEEERKKILREALL
jgi:2-oxoglutarate dehydrogenase E1 component